MTVREFLDKVEDINNSYAETRVHLNYDTTLMQWANGENYCQRDSDGKQIITERFSANSYRVKARKYNVIACFRTPGLYDYEEGGYYNSIANIVEYVKKALDKGAMKEDETLYLMYGQSVESDNLFEISDICYDPSRIDVYAGDMIDADSTYQKGDKVIYDDHEYVVSDYHRTSDGYEYEIIDEKTVKEEEIKKL